MGQTVEPHVANALVQFIRTKWFMVLDKVARVKFNNC